MARKHRIDVSSTFRASVSAAPLKRHEDAVLHQMVNAFRASVSAAPLKQADDGRLREGFGSFRASVSAAPLKRFAHENARRVLIELSALL